MVKRAYLIKRKLSSLKFLSGLGIKMTNLKHLKMNTNPSMLTHKCQVKLTISNATSRVCLHLNQQKVTNLDLQVQVSNISNLSNLHCCVQVTQARTTLILSVALEVKALIAVVIVLVLNQLLSQVCLVLENKKTIKHVTCN